MSVPNVLISNGTCYYGAGRRLDPSFLPCGNDAVGRQACCGAGDTCLEGNACFGVHGPEGKEGTLLTYLAGCSDPNYGDAACPKKAPFGDQPWAGLIRCANSNDWVACGQAGAPSTLRQGDACSCPDSGRTVAFTAGSTLTSSASLPTAAGGSIQWFAGHVPSQPAGGGGGGGNTSPTPTTAAPPGTTTIITGGSTVTSLVPTNTGSGTGPAGPSDTGTPGGGGGGGGGDGSLSVGAKAGIGVGAAVAGIAILGLLAAVFVLYRRRRSGGSRAGDGEAEPTLTGGPVGSSAVGGPGKEQLYAVGGGGHRQSGTISALSGDTGTSPGGYGASAAAAAGAAGSSPGGSTPQTQVSELEPRAARPWSMRSELEGTAISPAMADYAEAPGDSPNVGVNTGLPGMAGTGGAYGAQGAVGGPPAGGVPAGGHRGNVRSGELSPVNELPG